MSAQPRRQVVTIEWAQAEPASAEIVRFEPPEPWSERVLINAAWTDARVVMSVLIPFFRDDPCDLITALDREAVRLAGTVEIVVLDDGSADEALARKVEHQVALTQMPARFVRLRENEGRAKGRNRLAAHARGSSYLFLDADMRPDDDRFLQSWADLVALKDPAVAFGGFSLTQSPKDRKFRVHRRMAAKAECVPFFQRALTPEKYVYTSNLLVRRDAFDSEAFDDTFTGWGWEDVEWAMRMVRRFTVVHTDNPASHLGLDTTADLARKYEQSVGNYGRVVALHPEIVSTYPSYRAASMLKKLPALSFWRALFKQTALLPILPSGSRAFALRLYRASLYAETV
ncbi:MAG TPA: glycosyltransferase family 2 protein [Caulobacteraceae bacterium]|jgi:glycosyltransferase involved in cell wall biosynthesis